jgi:hypothetical protein
MNFPPNPLEIALATEHLHAIGARRENVRRTFDSQSSRLPGAVEGDSFNKSLDLTVKEQPSGKTPETAETGLPPLLSTKEGIRNTELVHRGSGMISNSTSEGSGKVNPWQEPLALTKKGPHSAEEIAEIKRVQMRQP